MQKETPTCHHPLKSHPAAAGGHSQQTIIAKPSAVATLTFLVNVGNHCSMALMKQCGCTTLSFNGLSPIEGNLPTYIIILI